MGDELSRGSTLQLRSKGKGTFSHGGGGGRGKPSLYQVLMHFSEREKVSGTYQAF